jgi:hypothetical protein
MTAAVLSLCAVLIWISVTLVSISLECILGAATTLKEGYISKAADTVLRVLCLFLGITYGGLACFFFQYMVRWFMPSYCGGDFFFDNNYYSEQEDDSNTSESIESESTIRSVLKLLKRHKRGSSGDLWREKAHNLYYTR